MKNKDINKSIRDSLDSSLESKFLLNLQWSMLFFVFNQVSNILNNENDFDDKNHVQKQFIKSWKKFAYQNIAMTDLKIINDILNSPKNIFYSALQNDDEITESTEIYQEKYDNMLKKIEKFFLQSVNIKDNYFTDNDEEEE